jgi:hypothetical protein
MGGRVVAGFSSTNSTTAHVWQAESCRVSLSWPRPSEKADGQAAPLAAFGVSVRNLGMNFERLICWRKWRVDDYVVVKSLDLSECLSTGAIRGV